MPQAHQPQGPPRSGEAQAGLVFLRMEEHNQAAARATAASICHVGVKR